MNKEEIENLKVENTSLKRSIVSLEKRLEKMQNMFAKQHEEIRKLRIEAGARKIGPHKVPATPEVNSIDKSNNI